MPQYRKPNPKSQQQISNDQVNPYVFPENGESYGNPNIPSNFNQFTPTEQSGIDFNRAEKLSFKEDTTKPFSVGLQDIDESIMFYFKNVIRPSVYQNGNRIEVPVIYGSPERWKSVQKDGFYKDKNGAIMAPLIMFKRDTVDKNRSITNKLDANYPHLYTSWKKSYNPKNAYSNFSVLTNRAPTEQFIANVVPDYVTITYNCTVQTYYVDQLNKIIEAINYASDSYWGDPERFKFKASIDSYTTIVEVTDTTSRVVKGTFSIKLFGYIIPDTIQKEATAIKKYNSRSKITIGLETVNSVAIEELPFIPISSNPIFIDGQTPVINYIEPTVLNYLNTNIQKLGTFVNSTTVTFASGWLIAPTGLPTTSVNNFTIFCNGTLIELAAIVSFTESGGTTTLTINPSELGYNFSSGDEIVAIGKFSN
jgi:hypothetical protein